MNRFRNTRKNPGYLYRLLVDMYKYNVFLFFLFLLLTGTDSRAQVTSVIMHEGNSKESVSALQNNGVTYISLQSLSAKFKIKCATHQQNGKVELFSQDYAMKFANNNAFIVITQRQNLSQEVVQMPVSSLQKNGFLYVPWYFVSPLLEKYLGRQIAIQKAITQPFAAITPKRPEVLTVKIEEKLNGTLVRFVFNNIVKEYSAVLQDGMLVVKAAPASELWKETPEIESNSVIESMTVTAEKRETIFKLKVNQQYATHELVATGEKSLMLTIHKKKFGEFSREQDPKKSKWKFDAVVIDAGHGGKDYGAIGVNNTIEKEINLAIALKLGAAIEREMPDVKVIYTRKNDTFVELFKRGKIANEQNGKLFISIHCNSVPHKLNGPHGYEIYLLRPGRTQEAISIAERENSVISYEDNPKRYQKLTDENFILVTMAHAANMKYSEKFSELLDKQLRQDVDIVSKGVKQAGFYVLVGASMPSILFETGYVTNEQDAAYMKSTKGQQEIASALCKAVKSFKLYYAREINSD